MFTHMYEIGKTQKFQKTQNKNKDINFYFFWHTKCEEYNYVLTFCIDICSFVNLLK
jgi:hypothetical protein